jgi:hypothetical protein
LIVVGIVQFDIPAHLGRCRAVKLEAPGAPIAVSQKAPAGGTVAIVTKVTLLKKTVE